VGSINNNVPSDPIGVAFAPSGAFAYVVGATTSNVYVINTATNTVVSSSMTTGSASGPYEFGVAVAPSDAYLYVTNFDVDTVSIISLVTNSLVGTITGAFDQPKGVAISPDGTYAYVTNWDSSNIVVISTATNTVVGSIDTVFDNPGAIAFSPDGSYAYVPNYGTDNVIIIGDGNVVTNIVDNGVSSGSGGGTFLGSVSNLQTYNISLSHYQVAKAYYSGIDGLALLVGNLTGWWPLNGNANDISGSANNGNVILSSSNSAPYTYLYGYTGDPVYDGSLYNASATLEIEGIYNCANYNQCKNLSRQHLYLGNVSLTSRAGIAMNESSSFGLPNSIVH
jgi:YVTN family beta-propeller protein